MVSLWDKLESLGSPRLKLDADEATTGMPFEWYLWEEVSFGLPQEVSFGEGG